MLTSFPILAAFISMFSFGITDFTAGMYAKKTNEYWAMFINSIIGLILLVCIFAIRPAYLQHILSLNFPEVAILSIIGLTNALAVLFLIKGLYEGNVGIVSGIGSNFGILVALLSAFLLGEILSISGWLFLLVASLGIVLASYDKSTNKKIAKGVPYALAAMFLWGIAIFLMIFVSREVHWVTIHFFTFTISVVLGTLILLYKKPKVSFDVKLALITLSVIFEMLAYYSLSAASSYENSGTVGAITGSYALVAIVLTAVILKERLETFQKLGLLLVLIGLTGVNLYG